MTRELLCILERHYILIKNPVSASLLQYFRSLSEVSRCAIWDETYSSKIKWKWLSEKNSYLLYQILVKIGSGTAEKLMTLSLWWWWWVVVMMVLGHFCVKSNFWVEWWLSWGCDNYLKSCSSWEIWDYLVRFQFSDLLQFSNKKLRWHL